MNYVDFGGNRLVDTIETKLVCASSLNLADMLTMVRGQTLLILKSQVKGEGHERHHRQMWGARGCYALRCYILIFLLRPSPVI